MESDPALMNLRLMRSIETAKNAGATLVMGVPVWFASSPAQMDGDDRPG